MSVIPTLGACKIPAFGVGTYGLRGATCTEAVRSALQAGFRLLDTATGYHNEELVAEGIRASGVERSSLFVIVKVSPKAVTTEARVEAAVRESVANLGIGYADVVLLHWPGGGGLKPADAEGHRGARHRAYSVLKRLQAEGLTRWLGVSNFLPRHFAEVDAICGLGAGADAGAASPLSSSASMTLSYPVVNQVELHPLCVQTDVVAHCNAHGIVPQQYSPLGQGSQELLGHPKLLQIVADHFPGRSVPAVLCMWGLSQGYCTLVRSGTPAHIEENWRAGTDYFAPIVATAGPTGGLTAEQHEILRGLRAMMGVDAQPDTHFCWYSAEVA